MSEHPIPTHTALPDALESLPLGDLLLPYQQTTSALLATTSLLVIEKSRRIGLTWGLASDAVLTAAAEKSAGGQDVMYISYSQDMTREFVDACAMWAKAMMGVSADVGELLFADQDESGKTREIKAFRISFASGFEIMALSSAPRSLRGKQGLLIIDEAAFVDSLVELLKAAMAFLIWGGKVVVVSTHNGVDNPFNVLLDEIHSEKRKGKTLTITFNDALAQGLYERIALVKGETPSAEGKAAFIADVRGYYGDDAEEELDCVPKTGAGCFLPPEDLAACEHPDAAKPELYNKGLVVIGRDVARRRDLAVIWAFEIVGNMLWLRQRWEKSKATFKEQDDVFDKMFVSYRVLRANIDQTGMGEKVVEDQVAIKGDRVQGVLFTGPNKLDMAFALKKRVEEHTIVIPPDPAIRADFRAIKKTKGAGDNVRLANDETVHADMFWAAALACLAAGDNPPTCHGYRPAGRPADRYDGAAAEDRSFHMNSEDADRASSGGRFGRGAW